MRQVRKNPVKNKVHWLEWEFCVYQMLQQAEKGVQQDGLNRECSSNVSQCFRAHRSRYFRNVMYILFNWLNFGCFKICQI